MYLKSLTLRGFKSFASATTLNLEPGITCVVGPNGSGKSNVVDALSWVMGEQGAKSLRGGKMEDVIFAGTAGRPPLGRAEVSLTIDNTDGALPIEYSEVTISRTMFRGGGSEYTINGTPCRLLDVQELLSRLRHRPRDARHRRPGPARRRAARHARGAPRLHRGGRRRPEAPQAQGEGAPQARGDAGQPDPGQRPDGRDPPPARAAGPPGRGGPQGGRGADRPARRAAAAAGRRPGPADQHAGGRGRRRDRAAGPPGRGRAGARPGARAGQPTSSRSPRPRRRPWPAPRRPGTGCPACASGCAPPRAWPASGCGCWPATPTPASPAVATPSSWPPRPAELREQERALGDEIAGHRDVLTGGGRASAQALEQALAEAQQELAVRQRAAADRREGLARLSGQVAARRSRIEAAEAEVGRLADATAEAAGRAARTPSASSPRSRRRSPASSAASRGWTPSTSRPARRWSAAEAEVERLRDAERVAERERATWTARREALELGLARKDGGGALLAASDQLSGVLGSVATLLTVEAGHEQAVAAALGAAADAVAVDSLDAAVSALRMLRSKDAGQAGLVVGAGRRGGRRRCWTTRRRWPAPAGRRALGPRARPGAGGRPPVAGPPAAPGRRRRATWTPRPRWSGRCRTAPRSRADGDVLAPGLVRGGSASAPSLLEVQAAADEAGDNAAAATRRAEQARFALAAAQQAAQEALERVEAALERLHDSDAQHAAVAERLGQLGAAVRSAHAEAERLRRAAETAGAGAGRRPGRAGRAGAAARRGRAGARAGRRAVHRRARPAATRRPAAPGPPRPRPGSRCAPPRSAAER